MERFWFYYSEKDFAQKRYWKHLPVTGLFWSHWSHIAPPGNHWSPLEYTGVYFSCNRCGQEENNESYCSKQRREKVEKGEKWRHTLSRHHSSSSDTDRQTDQPHKTTILRGKKIGFSCNLFNYLHLGNPLPVQTSFLQRSGKKCANLAKQDPGRARQGCQMVKLHPRPPTLA